MAPQPPALAHRAALSTASAPLEERLPRRSPLLEAGTLGLLAAALAAVAMPLAQMVRGRATRSAAWRRPEEQGAPALL